MQYLEWREKQYDERVQVDVFRPSQVYKHTVFMLLTLDAVYFLI